MTLAINDVKTRQEEWAELLDRARRIADKIRDEDREPTNAEKYELDRLLDVSIPAAKAAIARAEAEERDAISDMGFGNGSNGDASSYHQRIAQLEDGPDSIPFDRLSRSESPYQTGWQDAETGEPIRVLSNRDSMVSLVKNRSKEPLSLGKFLQAKMTGDWSKAQNEMRCAMRTGDNSLGGNLVPDEIAARVIDLARAKSVIFRAGAMTVPMQSDHLTIARVATDPTMTYKGENSAWTATDIKFDSIGFTARTFGGFVVASRELAADAPNFAQLVEQTLATSLASQLDNHIMVADATSSYGGMVGLRNTTGIGTASAGGAITYEDILTAATTIQTANHEPNAYIIHPTIAGDLAALQASTAGSWLGPPEIVKDLEQLRTSSIGTGNIMVGEFSNVLVGVRQNVEIMVSSTAEDFYSKNQVGFRIVMRVDVNVARADALYDITGITT